LVQQLSAKLHVRFGGPPRVECELFGQLLKCPRTAPTVRAVRLVVVIVQDGALNGG